MIPFSVIRSRTLKIAAGSLPALFALRACAQDYVPLAPLPGINPSPADVGAYIQQFFNLGIRLAIVLAVLMFVIGGVEYMMSEGVTSKDSAKKRMSGAVIGLLLAISSVLILQTINPAILTGGFIVSKSATPKAPTPLSTETPAPIDKTGNYALRWTFNNVQQEVFYTSKNNCEKGRNAVLQQPEAKNVQSCINQQFRFSWVQKGSTATQFSANYTTLEKCEAERKKNESDATIQKPIGTCEHYDP